METLKGIRLQQLKYCFLSCKSHLRKYQIRSLHNSADKNVATKGEWQSVVGLEIHAQINVISKLFSSGGTDYNSTVNRMVAHLDASLPGTLPVLNRHCVEAAVLTGLALHCNINKTSLFDRKHYFYADMPVGYQITQQYLPIAVGGFVEFLVLSSHVTPQPYIMKSKIKQIQLEQDSGRSLHIHKEQHSLVDLNRAGIGLMEIVLEPDLSNGEEASSLVKELALILKAINTCSCKMEEGAFRVDANVSVHRKDEPLGTRTEIKNLNSRKSLSRAIDYEIQRQIKELEAGNTITNETMMYNIKTKQTVPMRDKEVLQDYRFMPEPNLPPLVLLDHHDSVENSEHYVNIDSVRQRLPRLPSDYRKELCKNLGIDIGSSALITESEEARNYFNKLMAAGDLNPNCAATIFTKDLLSLLESNRLSCNNSPVNVVAMQEIVKLKETQQINSAVVTQIIKNIFEGDKRSPREIVEAEDLFMVEDNTELEKICEEVLARCNGLVKKHKRGKPYALPILLEKVQAASKGKADLEKAKEFILNKIEQT